MYRVTFTDFMEEMPSFQHKTKSVLVPDTTSLLPQVRGIAIFILLSSASSFSSYIYAYSISIVFP